MARIKVSVIIPVYNVARYIEKCARSLFEQTLDSMEFIFVDDCSTDSSVSVLENVIKDYPERAGCIHIRKCNMNHGPSHARNIGLEVASGEYIAYCDGDDWVDTDMYNIMYDEVTVQKADICCCDYNIVYENATVRQQAAGCSGLDKEQFMKRYISNGLTVLWNMIVKRSVYVDHDLKFPEYITYCEDFWLSVRLMYFAGKVSKVNEALYYYNRQNASSLLNSPTGKAQADMLRCYPETAGFFRVYGDLCRYERELSWRILGAKQEMVLNPEDYDKFLKIFPESHAYITSCPDKFCNKKIKLMMWLLVHKFGFIVTGINSLRKLAGR